MTDEAFFSNLIYNAYMADVINEIEAEEACYRLSIPYPPQQIKGYQGTHSSPVFTTSEGNPNGIHCN
jgi:hypothetical protein